MRNEVLRPQTRDVRRSILRTLQLIGLEGSCIFFAYFVKLEKIKFFIFYVYINSMFLLVEGASL